MNKMFIIGLILLIIGTICSIYWFLTAPFCCRYVCGCTTDMMECIYGNIFPIILTVGVMFIALSFILHNGEEEVKK